MLTYQSKILPLFSCISKRYLVSTITGLLLFSVALSYVFQEIVFQNHCFTKLGIILLGNLAFWGVATPVIKSFTKKNIGNRHFIPGSLALGAFLLFINQILIQKLIYTIFLYGFGCLEGVSNACYMLFENNILTAGLIYSILALVLYQNTVGLKKREVEIPPVSSETVETESPPVYKSYVTIKLNGMRQQVSLQNIRYIEACKNTLLIFAVDKKHVLYQSLVSFEKDLDPASFIKIHRSFLVNRLFIHSYSNLPNGNVLVKLKCGTELVMTRHYKTKIDG